MENIYYWASIIGTGITFCGVIAAFFTIRIGFKQIKQNQDLNKEANRAQVSLTTFKTISYGTENSQTGHLFLSLTNNGLTAAHSVKILSCRPFNKKEQEIHEHNKNMTELSMANKSYNKAYIIPYLATGADYKFPLIEAQRYFEMTNSEERENFKFQVEWRNFDGSISRETSIIDLKTIGNSLNYADDEIASRIHQSSKFIKKLDNSLKNIDKNLKNISVGLENPIVVKSVEDEITPRIRRGFTNLQPNVIRYKKRNPR